MKKADLQERLKALGLDTEGTVKELKARLAEGPQKAAKAPTNTDAKVVESPARKAYRMGAHKPKVRKGPRNLQVKADD